jgi:site-specific recombinase XerD
MGVSFKPVFNRNNTKTKSGLYSINLRVTIDREFGFFNPKLPKLERKYWQGRENKWVKDSHPQNHLFNKALMDRMMELQEYVNKLYFLNRPVTFKRLSEFFDQKGDKESFNDYIEHYLKIRKFNSPNTLKKYKTFKKHINKFNPKIKFKELGEGLILDYRDFLLSKGMAGSTILKYFDPFKKIARHALKNDYFIRDPFFEVKIEVPLSVVKRTSLTLNEIQALIDLKFKKKEEQYLELHRDIFVFECLTGLYYSDVRGLTAENFINSKSGQLLVSERFKNGYRYIVPLYKFPEAIRLLNKYKGLNNPNAFPTVVDQAFNRALKIIGPMAGIEKTLYNKVGRHTFCELLISKGYPREYVAKMAGHQNSKTTKTYFDISTSHFINELSGFEKVDFTK